MNGFVNVLSAVFVLVAADVFNGRGLAEVQTVAHAELHGLNGHVFVVRAADLAG